MVVWIHGANYVPKKHNGFCPSKKIAQIWRWGICYKCVLFGRQNWSLVTFLTSGNEQSPVGKSKWKTSPRNFMLGYWAILVNQIKTTCWGTFVPWTQEYNWLLCPDRRGKCNSYFIRSTLIPSLGSTKKIGWWKYLSWVSNEFCEWLSKDDTALANLDRTCAELCALIRRVPTKSFLQIRHYKKGVYIGTAKKNLTAMLPRTSVLYIVNMDITKKQRLSSNKIIFSIIFWKKSERTDMPLKWRFCKSRLMW